MFAFCGNIVLTVLSGYVTLRTLDALADQQGMRGTLTFVSALAIGFGLTTVLEFLSFLLLPEGVLRLVTIDAILLLIVVVLGARLWMQHRLFPSRIPFRSRLPAAGLLAVPIALLAAILYQLTLAHPHGQWDAWAIWNMHAKFLYLGGERWAAFFTDILFATHPDYPLLLPLLVSRGWQYAGDTALWVPAAIAGLFTIGIVLAVYGLVSAARSRRAAIAAALILLAMPSFIFLGGAQYADIPAAFFFILSAGLGCLAFQHGPRQISCRYLFWTGVMASLAAWTKNEGLLLVVVIAILVTLMTRLNNHIRDLRPRRALTWYLIGVAPVLLVLLIFKWQLAPSNDLIAGQGFAVTFDRLTDWNRYTITARAFGKELWRLGPGALITLSGLFLVFRVRRNETGSPPDRSFAWGVLTLMAIAYFFVFITTPQGLEWHLRTALSRLLYQLLPIATLAVCLTLPRDNP